MCEGMGEGEGRGGKVCVRGWVRGRGGEGRCVRG